MSIGRTPSTDDVRRTFVYSRAGDRTHRDQEYRDQFDRWLASVKAEALREAAEDYAGPIDPTCYLTTEGRKFIRARADEIEGATDE